MEKVITNGTSGKMYVNWHFNKKPRSFFLDSFGIANIRFIDNDDFKAFSEQNKDFINDGRLVVGKKSETKLNQSLEDNTEAEFKALSKNAKSKETKQNLNLEKLDKNAKSDIEVRVS